MDKYNIASEHELKDLFKKEKLSFASEIKALLLHPEVKREIDFNAFNNYFTFASISWT